MQPINVDGSQPQLSDETAYHFVIRRLEMRQKVIVASKQSHDINDPDLVKQLFRRTLERGIASPYVLSEIKPYLKSGRVNDEGLILAEIGKRTFHLSLRKLEVLQSVYLRQAKLKILLWGS